MERGKNYPKATELLNAAIRLKVNGKVMKFNVIELTKTRRDVREATFAVVILTCRVCGEKVKVA